MTKGIMGKEPDPREVYADIIGHPHHVSDHHPAMSLYDRAAQFSAYKALSGYEDMVNEEARTVDQMMEPGEDQVSELNAQLQALTPGTAAVITFFVPDPLKAGGKYVTVTEEIRHVDAAGGKIVLNRKEGRGGSRVEIPLEYVLEIHPAD